MKTLTRLTERVARALVSHTAYPLTAGRVHIHEITDFEVNQRYEDLKNRVIRRNGNPAPLIAKLDRRRNRELETATQSPGQARLNRGEHRFKGDTPKAREARKKRFEKARSELYSRQMHRSSPNP